ncbi:hypothetical protein P154DRAFT_536862 [Amniculicola lignicola CBS 123094]|uniref:Uncharacterized protein n=1 Tax=Amniculicola lignicola CBS 123094 TaxID=1392246 RepID=A0A6A5WA93_9PLEO|nr:hypothetical protein P154DRAFT_536862 [Amniculicola lignicola CBS 123094]
MLPTSLLVALLTTTTLASPLLSSRASALKELKALTVSSPACALPDANKNCAGSPMKDVIISYPSDVPKEQPTLILDATKSAGGKVVYDWQNFGFSGFVPEPVLSLIAAHGANFGIEIHENACAEIPWCGEAPC